MKFGVREVANVVFRAKSNVRIGNADFKIGQPVLYIDSAKTSTLEGAGTTVYAQGGRGNSRLVSWEGEKTLTFTVEDALMSPTGLSILSGAGLIKGGEGDKVHVHMTTLAFAGSDGIIDLTDALGTDEEVCLTAPLFVLGYEDGSLTGDVYEIEQVKETPGDGGDPVVIPNKFKVIATPASEGTGGQAVEAVYLKNKNVMVDYYILKSSAQVSEIQIDAENFAGYYYVEADTLFRRQSDGVDLPANITLPNVKIQSNFTFSMAPTGDPSTFTFTMDAMPGYTYFDNTKKVLCVIQVVEESNKTNGGWSTVMGGKETGDAHYVPGTTDTEFDDSLSVLG